jgi:hypothetical protein
LALASLECDLVEFDAECNNNGNWEWEMPPPARQGKTSLNGYGSLDEDRRFVTGAHPRTATDDESG